MTETDHPRAVREIVIFGALGNLSTGRLIPALFDLSVRGMVAPEVRIICCDPEGESVLSVRDKVGQLSSDDGVPATQGEVDDFYARFKYVKQTGATAYRKIKELSPDIRGRPMANRTRRLIYMAVRPQNVGEIVAGLKRHNLTKQSRIVLEKPFGYDLNSAKDLNRDLHSAFSEGQIYRIDHYLAKDTIQNIMAFRFGNWIIEKIWNRDSIDYVEVTVSETVGVGGREETYESLGAIRDMLQNHLLQILALLAMEAPSSLETNAGREQDAIRDERVKVLKAVRSLTADCVRTAQYTEGGDVRHGEAASYKTEVKNYGSLVETFVAARFQIDNWRWAGVPFYLRTGKRLPIQVAEVYVRFKSVPTQIFGSEGPRELQSNALLLQLQPDYQILLSILAKEPEDFARATDTIKLVPRRLLLPVNDRDYETGPISPYTRLLRDAIAGNQVMFLREDAVEEAWRIIEPVLGGRRLDTLYPAFKWPDEDKLDSLIVPTGDHSWRRAEAQAIEPAGSSGLSRRARRRRATSRPS